MLTAAQFGTSLASGAVLGAAFVGLAYMRPRYTRQILAITLVVAALAYVAFAVTLVSPIGERPRWLLIELAGVGVYGTMAVLGWRGSPWWLVAGWLMHPAWDVVLHYVGPGGTFAPTWWTVPCLSWDLVTAAYIAYRIIRRTHPIALETRLLRWMIWDRAASDPTA